MTQEEIIRMAREAGFSERDAMGRSAFLGNSYDLERFARLVAEPWIETNKALAKEIIEMKKQAEQEPVAAYKDAPRTIYLQTGCDDPDPFECGCSFNEWGDVSWCADKIHDTDIPYIRADYAAPVRTKDLTDAELHQIWRDIKSLVGLYSFQEIARAVIAADREKNK